MSAGGTCIDPPQATTVSPDEFPTELPDARRLRVRDITEAGIADVAGRVHELRMVEYIEEFSSNLDRHRFLDGEYLRRSKVGIVEPRPMEESAVCRPESSAIRARSDPGEKAIGLRERTLAKVRERARGCGGAGVRYLNRSHQIWHIGGGTSGKRRISHALIHLDRKSGREPSNALQLPSFRQPSRAVE